MLEDIVKIKPQTRKTYHAGSLEFATPVENPKEKARYYYQWGILFHARNKPAEAYKYYEKAIVYHKHPDYLKQMGLLHHEMGYLKDALKYFRVALGIEKAQMIQEAQKMAKQEAASETSFPTPIFENSSDTWDSTIYQFTHSGDTPGNAFSES